MKRFILAISFLIIGYSSLFSQIEGSIYKFKNQWEVGLGSQTFFPKTISQGIREIYSPLAYLSPLVNGTYMRKLRFGKMDYGYKRIHFLLLGLGAKAHWLPTINDKIFYTGLNRIDNTTKDTTILTKNRNGRASLSFFVDYTREFKQITGIRYRFGIGFEHHIVGANFANTTINDNPFKKQNTFFIYPGSLFSFSSTSVQWWARIGIDKRVGSFNYFGSTLMLGFGPEYKVVPDAQILPSLKIGIQLHYGFLGGYESVVRRK
jgi:hypothetical protein